MVSGQIDLNTDCARKHSRKAKVIIKPVAIPEYTGPTPFVSTIIVIKMAN
jgi:hypothetical protein